MGNSVFNYNKNDLHHRKTYKKTHIRLLNSFLIFQIVFELLLFYKCENWTIMSQ